MDENYNAIIQRNLHLLKKYGYIPEQVKSELEFDELEDEISNMVIDEEGIS